MAKIQPKDIFDAPKEGIGRIFPQMRMSEERCPEGYHPVMDHFRNHKGSEAMALEVEGIYVEEYCARDPKEKTN